MTNRKDPVVNDKRFVCDFGGCNRAFTRQEHLQRHSQNHLGGDYTCERCRAHFKRRDLLDRHVLRHRQKDAEGTALMTRKRSWKDVNGNIVTKKPKTTVGQERQLHGAVQLSRRPSPALVSPPISGGASNSSLNRTTEDDTCEASDPWTYEYGHDGHFEDTLATLEAHETFWELPDKASQDVCNTQDLSLYEDSFNPDTASSFNMPFTTMSNYNWLFDIDLSSPSGFDMNDIDLSAIPSFNSAPTTDIQTQQNESEYFNVIGTVSGPDAKPTISTSSLPPLISTNPADVQSPIREQPRLYTPNSEEYPRTQSSISSYVSSSEHVLQHTIQNRDLRVDVERPMAHLNSSIRFSKLDALAHSQILALVEIIRPVGPDGCYVARDHPLLSLPALQTYYDLYFSRFNTAYPIIHQATFEPSKVDTLLLISVLLLGATYGEKDAHQLAVCIHDVLRPQIFAHNSFNARPELWILQATLLVECFGKSRAGQKQHDMSHLFHGLLINLIRRSDCQIVQPESIQEGRGDLEDDWRAWVEGEQKKRLALLCFMWDTQHAVLFCQSLCMSAFELRSTLPCHQTLWEVDSAEKWQKLKKTQKTPSLFLTVLKSYLNTQIPVPAWNLNALSRVLILHGLMSIAWDMNRRDQTSLGIVGNDVLGDWRIRIGGAYDKWKADFDTYTTEVKLALSSSSSKSRSGQTDQHYNAREEFAIFTTVNAALYHAANVILFSDFLDIQIYAGARHILGRAVGRGDYSRSQRVVKTWANGQNAIASKAAWHAAHILKDAATNLKDFDAGGLFIHPWCLYLATITIWSYHHARPKPKAVTDSAEEEDDMIWDVKADMNVLIASMTNALPDRSPNSSNDKPTVRTTGLTALVAKHLSKIRWAIVHDGMLVLKGLVPWRLINEADAI